MNIWKYIPFKRKTRSASVAKERLQIIINHERNQRNADPDYLIKLQQEIIEVISKYVHINKDDIKVQLERHGDNALLELNVTMPDSVRQGEPA
jgi:cell division topological specificity factor